MLGTPGAWTFVPRAFGPVFGKAELENFRLAEEIEKL
jgi:hypothetical protein